MNILPLDDKQMTGLIVVGIIILGIVYVASESAGHSPDLIEGKGEVQFDAFDVGATLGVGVGGGGPLDMDHRHHGWHPGIDPSPGDQAVMFDRHRYPRHCGSNLTAVITRGFNPMMFRGPDPSWAMEPPSEVSL